jgi:hypothetical protein
LKKLNIDSHLKIPGPLIVEVDLQLLKAGNFSNEHFQNGKFTANQATEGQNN